VEQGIPADAHVEEERHRFEGITLYGRMWVPGRPQAACGLPGTAYRSGEGHPETLVSTPRRRGATSALAPRPQQADACGLGVRRQLFLWRQRRDYNGTEAMLTRALAAPHQNEMVRLKILNLYSLFMSITPPSATNLEKQRKMLEEPQ
jgi:hypothetical protein